MSFLVEIVPDMSNVLSQQIILFVHMEKLDQGKREPILFFFWLPHQIYHDDSFVIFQQIIQMAFENMRCHFFRTLDIYHSLKTVLPLGPE